MADDSGVILPPGVAPRPVNDQLPEGHGTVLNETDLPDDLVLAGVETFFEEQASVLGVAQGSQSLQAYSYGQGSLLARRRGFRTPQTPIEEIILARDMVEKDDDIAATIGAMLATAFDQDVTNTHADEVTVALFDEITKHGNLEAVFHELYRELLIASSITTMTAFTREDFQFQPQGADRQRTRSIVAPMIGVIPAELIRVVGNDIFGTGTLAYKASTASQDTWLREFFDPRTSAGRKAQMRTQDPVLTALLLEILPYEDDEYSLFTPDMDDPNFANTLYRLNPRMVARSSFPKGGWKYPRPLLTRNFPLLEAKRLLNIMDYALLEGGSNFLVVAKKGSDARPAQPEEVTNLRDVIKRASHSGVIIGDHRLAIEIITPKLDELLNASKRKLIGRKLAGGLLRIPDFTEEESGGPQAVLAAVEILSRVISSDRRLVTRHMTRHVYEEVVKRNPGQFLTGPAGIWWARIILQGANFFQDYVLALRDRGDIPRRYAVEAGGWDYDAAVAQRKLEKASGDDRVLTPAAVPFSAGGGGPGPQDRGGGRPAGSGPDNGAPGAASRNQPAQRPTRVIHQNPGETVRAMYDEEHGTYRAGEITYAILEQFEEEREIGRLTTFERRALDEIAAGEHPEHFHEGPLTIVPVNTEVEIAEVRAVRLAPGLSMLLGYRQDDQALLARAFCFREPEYDELAAQETALRWGYELPRQSVTVPADPADPPEEHAQLPAGPEIHVHLEGEHRGAIRLLRDEQGNIVGSEPVPAEED